MTEDEFIEAIWDQWPRGKRCPFRLLEFARQAVSAHPDSGQLKCMLADLLIMAKPTGSTANNDEILALYHEATRLDPQNPEAFESLAWFLDCHDLLDEAERAFRNSISLGAGVGAYIGLARVLAQMGKKAEAIELLETNYATGLDPEVEKAKTELLSGEWDPPE
ncbi:MAG: hypothetical protein KF864_05465 [Phycisphaeraceae bacterium]|nr:hypothetical protein [Phycisphaeraceae bacterium]